jgi:hypothetical protein
MMEPTQTHQVNVYRKMLAASVCSILVETGFDTGDKDCIGTLTEMIQCCTRYPFIINPLAINKKYFQFCLNLGHSQKVTVNFLDVLSL